MLLSGRGTVHAIKAWLRERMIVPLHDCWLERCEKAYRPPKPAASGRLRPGGSIWLIGAEPTEFPDADEAAWKEGLEAAKERMTRRDPSYVDSVRWPGDDRFAHDVAPEDHVVQIHDEGGAAVVYPHGRW